MPHRIFNLSEVAEYLHVPRPDVESLVRRSEIPHERKGAKLIFRRTDIDAWASQRILKTRDKKLADFHRKSSASHLTLSKQSAVLPELIRAPSYVEPALKAKTRASTLQEMVRLAEATGLVLRRAELLTSLQERERMCSTALSGGMALLHPRTHDPYMFEASFITLGRTVQPIPFGSPDGMQTDLFFLVCCQDDKIHLHVLARLCVLCYQTSLVLELRDASTAEQMVDMIFRAEQEVVKGL